jgi:hypothetical protein
VGAAARVDCDCGGSRPAAIRTGGGARTDAGCRCTCVRAGAERCVWGPARWS